MLNETLLCENTEHLCNAEIQAIICKFIGGTLKYRKYL